MKECYHLPFDGLPELDQKMETFTRDPFHWLSNKLRSFRSSSCKLQAELCLLVFPQGTRRLPSLNKVTIYLSINLSIYSYYKHLMVIGPHSIINQPILAMTKPGSAPYNGLYGEAPPGRGIYFRLQLQKGQGIKVEVWERSRNLSFRSVQRPKRAYRCIFRQWLSRWNWFCDLLIC